MTRRLSLQLRMQLLPWLRHGDALALHGIFFLTGLGMLVLGPVLPVLSQRWHLDDQSAGLLLGMQFLGAFFGAVTLRRDLGKNLLAGCAATVLGFGWVALATGTSSGFVPGSCGVLIAGFGLGRTITTINLIAGARFAPRRASALSLLNLTWGLGALSGPVIADQTSALLGISCFFGVLSAMNAIAMGCGLLVLRQFTLIDSTSPATNLSLDQPTVAAKIGFVALAFLSYGGIEASLSGWLSSLAGRSVGGSLHLGATATSALWIGMVAGRAIAALLLLRAAERTFLIGALGCSGILTMTLLLPRVTGVLVVVLALGLGLSLAGVYPTLCSFLLAKRLPARTVGRVMAMSALGGTIFPWLVGIVSRKTGALQDGLWLPVALFAVVSALVLKIAPRERAASAAD